MNAPYYADDAVTLWHGDALSVLRDLPSGSVACCVTSPPYFGLRDYGVAGQLGAESSPAGYVEAMRGVFAEVRRVLADDGTLWLNLGDSYSAPAGQGNKGATVRLDGGGRPSGRRDRVTIPSPTAARFDRPAKNLLMIPARVALALQDDGWILRNDIIWSKSNGMPESVTDRLSTKHEHVFMLSKAPTYWFELDAIREPHAEVSIARAQPHRADPGKSVRGGLPYGEVAPAQTLALAQALHRNGRNPGDVWTIPTQPYPEAHFAVMPKALAERCIVAGCRPGGVVLDPFSGSGTTGLAAAKHGRRYVGIDLNAKYLDLSLRTRLAQGALIDDGGAA